MTTSYKALFLSHGGGPLPLLGDPNHREMVECLQAIAGIIPKPDAIVVVSAHWEERVPTITSGENPELIYDYYGFPPESYEIRYPCPGKPALAKKLHDLLSAAGIDSQLDAQRGFDHGVFVPLKIMYPNADIPCVQLSVLNSLNAEQHIEIGRALQSLHKDNVLVIGSGFTFHNMKAFFSADSQQSRELNYAFEDWLLNICSDKSLSEQQRAQRLSHWSEAPGARFCHPREEHLLPLHVCYGVAESTCTKHFELEILKKKTSMFLW